MRSLKDKDGMRVSVVGSSRGDDRLALAALAGVRTGLCKVLRARSSTVNRRDDVGDQCRGLPNGVRQDDIEPVDRQLRVMILRACVAVSGSTAR